MPESESSFYFLGSAKDAYESITSIQHVIEVWEQLAYIQEQGFADHENVFEVGDGLDTYKVMYGPAYTIAFQNDPDDSLTIFAIRRSGLLRLGG